MSAPTGIGALPVHKTSIQTKPVAASAPTGYSSGKKSEGRGEPRFSGLADAAGSLLARGEAPKWLQETFLFTANEGASAVLPLEAAVVAGRTQSAYRRDGWMEVQERVFEEVAAAAIWLKGVDFLKDRFKSGQNRFLPQYKHLSPDIAWNRPWGKVQTVDLTAQELFAKDSKEISSLLRLKSARWLFSVGLALTGVAYVVPTLNQLKTKAIMSYQMSRRKRSQEGDNVQFGDPRLLGATASPHGLPTGLNHHAFGQQLSRVSASANAFNPIVKPVSNPSSNSLSIQLANSGSSINPPYRGVAFSPSGFAKGFSPAAFGPMANGQPIRFGGFSGGSSVTQALGHLVDQTPYGSILVVDAGIAGGRGYVASKRSGFETVEVIVRDLGSLYFYILSVPHIMKGLGMAADSAFKTSSSLEPKIAKALHDQLKQADSLSAVKTALQGNGQPGLMLPESWLKKQIRTADAQKVAELLALEAQVYLGDERAQAFVERIRNTKGSVMPDTIQEWLTEISQGQGAFKGWTAQERQNLAIALKQAFRHSVGMTVDLKTPHSFVALLEKQAPGFAEAFESLGEAEQTAFHRRLRGMAQVDALDQAHSVFQRTINLLRNPLKGFDFSKADESAEWLNGVKNRGILLDDLAKQDLHAEGREKALQTMSTLLEQAKKAGLKSEIPLLEQYHGQLKSLLSPDAGRLFSLATQAGEESLNHKLRELLQGGWVNNTAFLRQAQETLGQFTPDSRVFADPARAHKMREAIGKYSEALLNYLAEQGQKDVKTGLDRFLKLNSNLNYTARSAALLGTMACLGWLVPHVQTTITKRLTGKDKNPGIASTANQLGYGDVKKASPKGDLTSVSGDLKGVKSTALPPAVANGIFVGQTMPRFYPRVGQTAYQN